MTTYRNPFRRKTNRKTFVTATTGRTFVRHPEQGRPGAGNAVPTLRELPAPSTVWPLTPEPAPWPEKGTLPAPPTWTPKKEQPR